MNPRIWGPVLWASLIYIVQNYPATPTSEHKQSILSFFQSLGPVLPCDICQTNYKKDFLMTDKDLESSAKLMAWLLELHNRSTGPNNKLSLEQFICKYTTESTSSKNKTLSKNKNKQSHYPNSVYKPYKRRLN